MIRAAMVSMNMPTIRSRMLISRMIKLRSLVIDSIALAIVCGICSAAMIQPKTLAIPTRARRAAEVMALSMTIFGT